MCGIAGIISKGVNTEVLNKMISTLAHRGPDGSDVWINQFGNAGLAHRRLSVIDPSPRASQPMTYRNRYTIVHNGEIYNYIELKKELRKAGYDFYSESDTEVILAAYDFYRNKCLQFLDGVFAFAIWDEQEQTLFAARDRFGEKPFYYWYNHFQFAFASEMKALWAAGVEKIIDHRMMLNYLTLGQLQNPSDKAQTFYEDIISLPPAHYLMWSIHEDEPIIRNYWNIDKQIQYNVETDFAVSTLDKILSVSVKRRLRSDIPVGMSLSGGLDSSTLAWYISKEKSNFDSFKSFTVEFPGFELDESAYVSELKTALPHINQSIPVTGNELADDMAKLIYHQEEPFPSSSIYAQYRLYKQAAAAGIRVMIDGQGADEPFAGYPKYVHWFLQELISRNRFILAAKEKRLLHHNEIPFSWGLRNMFSAFLPSHSAIVLEKREYGKILHHPDLSASYLQHLKGREWEGISKPFVTKLNDILYFNTMGLGLEELLRFADRNSMAHGVEVRLPFLQHELVEFAFSLPSTLKIRDGYTKWIIRKMMEDRLPAGINWRKGKIGFEPPQKDWMEHTSMKDLIMDSRKKLVDERILKPSVMNRKIIARSAHARDNFDWRYICAAEMMRK